MDIVPSGEMTVLPTAVILARDLQVAGSFSRPLVDQMNSRIAASASVGFGPFSIAGRFSIGDQAGSKKGTVTTTGLSAPDVQLMAYVCGVLPASPNPDPSLPWPPA